MNAVPTFPTATWPVYGHAWAVHLLQQTLATDAAPGQRRSGPSHAYLFLGIQQVGKTTLARAFATALLCTAGSKSPCGRCRACMLMERGSHPDFHLVQPTNKDGAVDRDDGELRTDRANDLVHDAALRPLEGKWRIFLIQDMHLANASFSNKILKTLEEPPPQTILLLTATDRKGVLPTIASRCQVLELRPLDRLAVGCALQDGGHASAEEADLLARLANGRIGWALQQVQHPERRSERLEQLETLRRLLGADRIARLDFAASLVTKRDRDNRELFGMLALWTTWWRDVMLVQAGCDDAVSNADQLAEVRRQAAAIDGNTVRSALQTLHQIDGYLHHTVNARLALEVLMLKLPKLEGSGS